MPTNDYTSKLLEMEDAIIENLYTTDTEVHIHFHLERRPHACPYCGAVTDKVHDYRTSILKDLPIMGKSTFLHYKKRRYHCDCCNKHFYESFNYLPKQSRIMTRLALYALSILNNKQSVTATANMLNISNSSVFRFLKNVSYTKPKHLPEVLSIDEFRGNFGGQKFHAILTDAKKHKLFDILPTRSQTDLMLYFQSFKDRKNVKYFIMDMNRVYRDLAIDYFPNATIVIDKFHVVRYVTWAVENVRKRVQKQMHPSKRKYFKRSRLLLLTHKNKLNSEGLLALEVMLRQSEDLAIAYYLKELFYEFMSSHTRAEAGKKLEQFIMAAQLSNLSEFNACLTMLSNWSKYILNCFECPYTNGYTEGTNNAIKVIKRNAFGFRNFKNFRNRIFIALT